MKLFIPKLIFLLIVSSASTSYTQGYEVRSDTLYKVNIYVVKNEAILTMLTGVVTNIKNIDFSSNEKDLESFVCTLYTNMNFFVPLNTGLHYYNDIEFTPSRMMKKIHKKEFTKEFPLYDAYITIKVTRFFGEFYYSKYDHEIVTQHIAPIDIKKSCFNNDKTVVTKKVLSPIKLTKEEKLQLEKIFTKPH